MPGMPKFLSYQSFYYKILFFSGRRKPKADYRAPPPSDYLYEVAILPKKTMDDLVSLDPDSPMLQSYPKAELSPQEIL